MRVPDALSRPSRLMVKSTHSFIFTLLSAFAASSARAEDHVDIDATYFLEPAGQQRLQVIHPQATAAVDLGRPAAVRVGYDADIVTGATPRTYSRVDVMTAATSFSDVRHAFHGALQYRTGAVTLD